MKRFGILMALSLCGSTAVQAQIYHPITAPGVMFPVVMNPCPGGKCPGVASKGRGSTTTRQTSPRDSRQATPQNAGSLVFVPNEARRREHLARFLRKSNNDPAMRDIVNKADQVFPMLADAMRSKGMNADNVADAYATWWIAAFDATHGNSGTRSAMVYQAVRAQSVSAVLAAPELRGATQALKQEMAEALLVQTILIDTSVEQAKNDPARMQAIGKAVGRGAQQMGLDLDTMTLTEAGFSADHHSR